MNLALHRLYPSRPMRECFLIMCKVEELRHSIFRSTIPNPVKFVPRGNMSHAGPHVIEFLHRPFIVFPYVAHLCGDKSA
jgi:hypothetical protein